ncbi:VOC family protein [Paenibacillus sabinae]|uniref:Glyoxalase/bleomycin resistance protein/dioxygenase n=1 Tax=Paenibacillus sabinae T27 TaxID=1268072 RepID=X5A7A1_9BACL|nr:VOC family protein [Paenibacillus sabinae]AHV99679.1 glyoxalase/bleomycin resistance protein/dioxygenase [Paenibacillus sabinae T27]
MNLSMNWITLRVRDLEASLNFYHGILKLPIQRRFESRGRQIAMLGTEGQPKVELIQGSEPVLKAECGVSIGFEVESLDEAMAYLKSLGIPVARGPVAPNPRLRFFYILDPDCFEVQLAEHSD